MTHDSWKSFKIKNFDFKKFQNSKKNLFGHSKHMFSVLFTRYGQSTMVNEQCPSNIRPEKCQKWPKKKKWDRIGPGASIRFWCFFSANIILRGPKKSTISSPEAIRKIEVNNTHSCLRDVPSMLNVPKRPNIKVSFYISLSLSSQVIPFWYQNNELF